jgi:2-dehydropantoate 2-reductase
VQILILGAGAIGGYFGGRLVQAGADVTFLVRERRAAQLAAHGLVVKSPHGDFTLDVRFVQQAGLRSTYELVIVACKAYDLNAAIDSIRSVVGPGTHVLPLLNGLAHIDRLRAEFGAARVLAGTCRIPATLTADGEIHQLGPFHAITYGPLPGASAEARAKLDTLHEFYRRTPVEAARSDDMMLELWEKFVMLATLAAMTCLMRASVGDVMATDDGEALMAETLAAAVQTAAAAGYRPREQAQAGFRKMLFERGSPFTASMLRDLESGQRVEADHIVGDMLKRARAAGVDPGPFRAAYCHLQASQARPRREGGK